MASPLHSQTVDPDEIERFSRIAEEWWDENGKFRPLHRINPLRIKYIRDAVCGHMGRSPLPTLPPQAGGGSRWGALAGLTVLDIGCGGGLLCEPLTRLGAHVTGIDAAEKNIRVASLHAKKMGLEIDYRCAAAEELVGSGPTNHEPRTTNHSFDIVLALEIVEHVADVPAFLAACAALVKPGGMLFMSTLNRTLKSYALAIIGAEYVLRWLPRGTHTWHKFLKPSELCAGLRKEGLHIAHMSGMTFNPLKNTWRMDENDLSVNYIITAIRPSEWKA